MVQDAFSSTFVFPSLKHPPVIVSRPMWYRLFDIDLSRSSFPRQPSLFSCSPLLFYFHESTNSPPRASRVQCLVVLALLVFLVDNSPLWTTSILHPFLWKHSPSIGLESSYSSPSLVCSCCEVDNQFSPLPALPATFLTSLSPAFHPPFAWRITPHPKKITTPLRRIFPGTPTCEPSAPPNDNKLFCEGRSLPLVFPSLGLAAFLAPSSPATPFFVTVKVSLGFPGNN